MYAVSARNTDNGIQERRAAARVEEHYRRKRELQRLHEEELERLKDRELYQQQQLDRTRAMRAELAEKLGEKISPRMTYAEIERRACNLFKCKRADIRSDRRHRDIVFARQFIAYWSFRLTSLSSPQIGKFMKRDHTSILHGKDTYVVKRAKMGRYLREVR